MNNFFENTGPIVGEILEIDGDDTAVCAEVSVTDTHTDKTFDADIDAFLNIQDDHCLESALEEDSDYTAMSSPSNNIQIYLNEVKSKKRLTDAELNALFYEYQATHNIAIRDKIAEHNLCLVLNVVKRYTRPESDFLDLIQEGSIGLMRAIEKFDPAKGYKFSTYAVWWVRQRIGRGIAELSNPVHIPAYMQIIIRDIKRLQDTALIEHGKSYNADELAKLIGQPKKHIEAALMNMQKISSIDAAPECYEFEDSCITPEQDAEIRARRDDLLKAITHLTHLEQEIIVRRYGIDKHDSESCSEIAKTLGYSKQRISQIELTALEKIRQNPESMAMLRAWFE